MKPRGRGRQAALVALVLGTVAMQLVVAILLKELADAQSHSWSGWLLLGLSVAVALNAARFATWAYIHRRYPLSHSYPLTALFFPCILVVSAWYGDPVSWQELSGVALIMAGIALMNWDSADEA